MQKCFFMAKKLFSRPVAKYDGRLCSFSIVNQPNSLTRRGLVRNWFEACDERGILANHSHVEQLYNMHVFYSATETDIDFDHFPSAVTQIGTWNSIHILAKRAGYACADF